MNERRSGEVELLLGPYRSGKTTSLIEELISFKEKDQLANVFVLVPSARYARLLKERIARQLELRRKEGPAGIFGLEILPFYHACTKILTNAGITPRILAEEIRPAILSRILQEMKADCELSSLAPISDFHGTSAAVLELIDELERAGLAPADVLERLESSSCQESHLIELAHVYERYWQRLRSLDYYDQKSLALKAREELFADTKKQEYELILIDGFDRVSHLQAQVFAGLAKHSSLTKLVFDYLPQQNLQNIDSNAIQIRSHGAEHGPAPSAGTAPLSLSPQDYSWKESSYNEILRNLSPKIIWSAGGSPASAATARIYDAGEPPALQVKAQILLDPFLEMVELTRHIKQALSQRGVAPNELIVITRQPDAYNGAIEQAFADAGIPYFIDGSSKVFQLEPWRFIARLFSLADKAFKRKALIDLLRSPFFKLDALSMTPRDLSLIDRRSYEARLCGGEPAWINFLKKEDFSSFSIQTQAFIQKLKENDESQSAKAHAKHLEDILEEYMQLPASDADLRGAEAWAERETIAALRRTLKVLILQDSLLCQEPETFAQFFHRVRLLIEKANYARPRPKNAAVTICSAELVPNMLFKEIYIAGLVEGDFPKHQSSRGLLAQEQVRLWLSFGIDIRNPRQEPGFERALFYSLSERAISRLHLSLPQYNTNSEETLPSFYIEELNQSTGLSVERISAFSESTKHPVSVRDALSASLWRGGMDRAWRLAAKDETINRNWQKMNQAVSALIARNEGDLENLYNGYLRDFFETGALRSEDENTWTPSKINDYGKCPFRYWATHILSLRPREEPEQGLNYALIGLFYHKVLELFFIAYSANTVGASSPILDLQLPPLNSPRARMARPYHIVGSVADSAETEERPLKLMDADISPLIDTAFEHGIAWLEARSDFEPGPYWLQEQKDLKFRIKRFIEKELRRIDEGETVFSPALFEANFGTKSANSFPALQLKGRDGKTITVRGSIDRVDFAGGEETSFKVARIVDYKSGSRSISIKEAEQGRNLQLPIYALALEQCISPGTNVSEADYLSISSARPVGHMGFDKEKHAQLKDLARQYILEYTDSSNRGLFTVKPKSRADCKDCLQATVCRVNELRPGDGTGEGWEDASID